MSGAVNINSIRNVNYNNMTPPPEKKKVSKSRCPQEGGWVAGQIWHINTPERVPSLDVGETPALHVQNITWP